MFPSFVQLGYADVFKESATKQFPLGTVGFTPDGSKYRYCKAGAAMTSTWGKINYNRHLTGVTGESSEAALTVAIAAGDKSFAFADTNTRVKDYFADGYVVCFGNGAATEVHRIRSSTLGDATSITCYLEGDDAFYAASTVGNTVNVYPSPWGNVRTPAQNGYEAFVCVNKMAITSAYYFWGLVNGLYWTTVTSTWPLAASRDLQVCFHLDGSFLMADEAYNGALSNQLAGHVVVSGNYGDCLIMLQIE